MGDNPSAEKKNFWPKLRRNLDSAIIIALAAVEFFYAVYHLTTEAHNKEEHLSLFVLAGIGLIFGVAGYERTKQREKIEREIIVLKNILAGQKIDLKVLEHVISGYQLIHGLDDITNSAREGIRNAKEIIRSTSFICPIGADVGSSYFTELAHKIKHDQLNYFCCFDGDYDFSERKRIFKESNFDEKDYGRMHYIQFLQSRVPHFDFIIIDNTNAFIAFPTLGPEMHLMIRIEAITKQNQEVINGLIYWYERLERVGVRIPNTRQFFEGWPNSRNKKRA